MIEPLATPSQSIVMPRSAATNDVHEHLSAAVLSLRECLDEGGHDPAEMYQIITLLSEAQQRMLRMTSEEPAEPDNR